MLSWDNPDNATITEYVIKAVEGTNTTATVDIVDIATEDEGTILSHTVETGLTAGTSYTFTVQAVNAAGDEAQSLASATPS